MAALPRTPLLERSVLGTGSLADPTDIDVLVEEIAELRPLPPIAAQVLQIAEGDHFSAHVLAQAISSDPALTARVLRVANSAYYGFPRRITTIRDAVVLLGFRQVRSTLLAATVMQALPTLEHVHAFPFWRHSVVVGLLAGLLARAEGVRQDEAFTAGVLHNIGRVALDQAQPELFRRALDLAESGMPLPEAQRRVFGFTDADLGGALARSWGFPPALDGAIARHAEPLAAFADPSSLPALVARARAFAGAHGLSDGVEAPASPRPRPRPGVFAGSLAVMSSLDLPSTDIPTAGLPAADFPPATVPAAPCGAIACGSEDALGRLVREEGGLEAILDRAAAFVELTAVGS